MKTFSVCFALALLTMYTKIYRPLCLAIFLVTPYVAMVCDRAAYVQRGYIAYGGEMFLPLIMYGVVFGLWHVGYTLSGKLPLMVYGAYKADLRRARGEK